MWTLSWILFWLHNLLVRGIVHSQLNEIGTSHLSEQHDRSSLQCHSVGGSFLQWWPLALRPQCKEVGSTTGRAGENWVVSDQLALPSLSQGSLPVYALFSCISIVCVCSCQCRRERRLNCVLPIKTLFPPHLDFPVLNALHHFSSFYPSVLKSSPLLFPMVRMIKIEQEWSASFQTLLPVWN